MDVLDTIKPATPRYLSTTETAKAIRLTLAKRFPGVKFSVRSKVYSGGSSIHINWTDGPRQKTVEKITDGFSGASFDGMNDLKSYVHSWLLPDGTAALAERPDSYGGSIPAYYSDAPHPNAELVSFGADFVFCDRSVTDWDRRFNEAAAYIRAHCHCEGEPPNDRFGNDWVEQLARAMARTFEIDEPIEATFERVVINHGWA